MTIDELTSEHSLELETARQNLWVAFMALMDDAVKEGRKIKDIAEGIGVTPRTILSYTKQQNFNPTFDVLFNISRYFNAPIDWMIGKYDLDQRSLDTAEKSFGLSNEAAIHLNRLIYGSDNENELKIYELEDFDPPMLAKRHGELCTISSSGNVQKYHAKKDQDDESIVPSEEEVDENCARQLATVNEMLEDWTLISLINAYRYSIPISMYGRESLKKCTPICYDSVILRIIEMELNKMRGEHWENLSQYPPGSEFDEVK